MGLNVGHVAEVAASGRPIASRTGTRVGEARDEQRFANGAGTVAAIGYTLELGPQRADRPTIALITSHWWSVVGWWCFFVDLAQRLVFWKNAS